MSFIVTYETYLFLKRACKNNKNAQVIVQNGVTLVTYSTNTPIFPKDSAYLLIHKELLPKGNYLMDSLIESLNLIFKSKKDSISLVSEDNAILHKPTGTFIEQIDDSYGIPVFEYSEMDFVSNQLVDARDLYPTYFNDMFFKSINAVISRRVKDYGSWCTPFKVVFESEQILFKRTPIKLKGNSNINVLTSDIGSIQIPTKRCEDNVCFEVDPLRLWWLSNSYYSIKHTDKWVIFHNASVSYFAYKDEN